MAPFVKGGASQLKPHFNHLYAPDSFKLNICNVKFVPMRLQLSDTVNVEIFGQYIFSRISRMVSDARKYDMSENLNHYRLNGIRYKIRQNMSTRKCHKGLDARKFSSAKISTFTVFGSIEWYL